MNKEGQGVTSAALDLSTALFGVDLVVVRNASTWLPKSKQGSDGYMTGGVARR